MKICVSLLTLIILSFGTSFAQNQMPDNTAHNYTLLLEKRLGIDEVRHQLSSLQLEIKRDFTRPSIVNLSYELENLKTNLRYSVKDLQAVQKEIERRALHEAHSK